MGVMRNYTRLFLEMHMKRRTNLYKRIVSAFLVAAMLLAGTTTAYADKIQDAKEARDEAQKKLDKVNKEINEINAAQEELQAEMDAYDEALMALLTDLTLLEEDIIIKQLEIEQAEKDLAAAEAQEVSQYEAMKLRIQYMYENSESSMWTSLVSSSGLTDALNRAEYISSVYEYDREQLTAYQETVQQVINLKGKLDGEMNEMEELQTNLAEQQNELEVLIAESNERMEGIEAQLKNASALAKKYAKTIKQQNKIIADEEKRIAAEKAAAAAAANKGSLTGSANPSYKTNVNGQDVVNYACQFVGNPYVYGGTSLTNGCDCSYFVKACFGHYGISLPRTSYLQRSAGQAVSYSNAKAGDIICYAGHVAIYMGNGRIVHAASKSQGICYGTATYRTIVAVRRVL